MAEALILEFAGLTDADYRAALGAAGVTAVPAVRWVPLVAYHVSET